MRNTPIKKNIFSTVAIAVADPGEGSPLYF